MFDKDLKEKRIQKTIVTAEGQIVFSLIRQTLYLHHNEHYHKIS